MRKVKGRKDREETDERIELIERKFSPTGGDKGKAILVKLVDLVHPALLTVLEPLCPLLSAVPAFFFLVLPFSTISTPLNHRCSHSPKRSDVHLPAPGECPPCPYRLSGGLCGGREGKKVEKEVVQADDVGRASRGEWCKADGEVVWSTGTVRHPH
jgi:hypothetical protein